LKVSPKPELGDGVRGIRVPEVDGDIHPEAGLRNEDFPPAATDLTESPQCHTVVWRAMNEYQGQKLCGHPTKEADGALVLPEVLIQLLAL
jgi:hypothetical protein